MIYTYYDFLSYRLYFYDNAHHINIFIDFVKRIMMAKNKMIIDLDVHVTVDPNRRMTDENHKDISTFLNLDNEGREQYLRNFPIQEIDLISIEA